MTFLAIRQMMSKYFDFIGVGRPELIEKDFAVEKYATNEGGSSSRAIEDGEDGGQNDADCLNDTYYFSKCTSKSSVSYRHEKASFRSITSITWLLKAMTVLCLISMVVSVEGFEPLPDGGNCFYGPCSWVNSNLAGTAARLRDRVRVAGRVVSVFDDICHRIQKNDTFVPLFPCAKYRISKSYVDELDERNERDQGDERVIRGILRNHGERNIVSGCNRRHGHLTAPIPSSQRPVVDPRRRLGCDGGFKPTSLGTSTARSVEKRYRYVKVPNEECPSPRTNYSKINARNRNGTVDAMRSTDLEIVLADLYGKSAGAVKDLPLRAAAAVPEKLRASVDGSYHKLVL